MQNLFRAAVWSEQRPLVVESAKRLTSDLRQQLPQPAQEDEEQTLEAQEAQLFPPQQFFATPAYASVHASRVPYAPLMVAAHLLHVAALAADPSTCSRPLGAISGPDVIPMLSWAIPPQSSGNASCTVPRSVAEAFDTSTPSVRHPVNAALADRTSTAAIGSDISSVWFKLRNESIRAKNWNLTFHILKFSARKFLTRRIGHLSLWHPVRTF